MPDVRPVWLTREQRDIIDSFYLDGLDDWASEIRAITNAWDAAPADPTEPVLTAIDNGYRTDADEAASVLRALGMPDA